MRQQADRVVQLSIGSKLGTALGTGPVLRRGHESRPNALPSRLLVHEPALEVPDRPVLAPLGIIAQRDLREADRHIRVRDIPSDQHHVREALNSAVLQIQEIKVVVAAVRVPEIYLGALSRGTPADLSIDGLQDTLRSEIFVINDKADPTSRSLDVRFALANYDYRIKPGLFVQAEIHLPERLAMLLNHEAVLDRQNSPHVFLAKDGVAQRRDIVLNDFDATGVEVVAGLNDEDFVLIGPDLSRLVDGTPLPEDINADR